MLRPTFALRAGRVRFGSTFALAATALVATSVLAPPALAQRSERNQRPAQQQDDALSRNFQPLYLVVSEATNTAGDFAAAKAGVPAMVAAIASEYDRFFAGNILLQLGAKSQDRAIQKQGLELMLASGRATPENVGLFRYYLAGIAYDNGDYDGAIREAKASLAAGFAGNIEQRQDPWLLQADSLLKLNRHTEGLAFLKTSLDQRLAAGQPVPASWYARALGVAYEQRLAAEAGDWAALMVKADPSPTNWKQALQVVNELGSVDEKIRLDGYRLMALTGSLNDRGDFARYIEAADPRAMSNEVSRVLAAATAANAFTTTDDYYREVKSVVDANAAKDRADAPTLAREARAAAGTARNAQSAGDVYLSLENYAEAEAMYALALTKQGGDRDLLLTRQGIAQARQNKWAEAKATFAQVGGERAALAKMWTAYVEAQG
jgi:tetratricopeptide (TPR) repeat protein